MCLKYFFRQSVSALKTQSQRSLEPPASGLVHDLAESCVAGSVDIHIRCGRQGMVHYVECIDANLHDLRFRDMERFAEVSVDTRQDRPVHHELAEGAALPGQGILQQDLSRICISYCLKRAQRRESRGKR